MRRESISEHLNGFEQDIMNECMELQSLHGEMLNYGIWLELENKKCRNNFFQKQDFIHSCGLVLQVPTLTWGTDNLKNLQQPEAQMSKQSNKKFPGEFPH